MQSLFTNRPLRLTGWPVRDGGKTITHGIFELADKRKFIRRNVKATMAAMMPITTLTVNDLMKISVNPTSENHHQSVTRSTIAEEKIRIAIIIPMNAHKKRFVIFINVETNYTISNFLYIDKLSKLGYCYCRE